MKPRTNSQGSTLIELLVVTGAIISTGVTAIMVFREVTQANSAALARLALYDSLRHLERRLEKNCMGSLFTPDATVPFAEGDSLVRTSLGDLVAQRDHSTSAGHFRIESFTMVHRYALGRDTSLIEYIIKSRLSREQQSEDRFPVMVRTKEVGPNRLEAVGCSGLADEQLLSFLPFFGLSGPLAKIANSTELLAQLSCQRLANTPCQSPLSPWGVTDEGEPIDPLSGGDTGNDDIWAGYCTERDQCRDIAAYFNRPKQNSGPRTTTPTSDPEAQVR